MVKNREFPEDGELVVGTVKGVQNFGAFVKLEEYPGKEGFIHIAEVASGWVKHIRDHVRDQQRVVCKVIGVDTSKGHVDLSLKRVNDHQKRDSIQLWKNEQKAEKLFEMVAEKLGRSVDGCYAEFGNKLLETYDNMYTAFEEAAYEPETLQNDGFEGDWLDAFSEIAGNNIVVPFVDIRGYLNLVSHAPDGIKMIKNALADAEKSEYEDVNIKISYIGAPHYMIKVRAPDYKVAEEEMKKAVGKTLEKLKTLGGEGSFSREHEEKKSA
ncbi:MAG: translation initiation factor IF-2 subunit alpha [Thermoplasmata archaeon HGW-Thermoplasmata-1]|nr:MAG: translation initiation factor IF-2 subunit alpha [Thermoplasmata archaeon HGW-Thermoplasmata-1]